jgi:hypothetical protein
LAIRAKLYLRVPSLTCRKRRVKCDETRPCCKNCTRTVRNCEYSHSSKNLQRPRALSVRRVHEAPESINSTSLSGDKSLSGLNEASIGLSPTSNDLSSSSQDATQTWIPVNTSPLQVASTALLNDSFFLNDTLCSSGDTHISSLGP